MQKPIYDNESEQALLGCMFENKQCIPSVTKMIKTGDFYRKEHQIVYEAIQDIFDKTNTGDIMAVAARIKEKDLVNRIGGLPFLYDITNHVIDVVNWAYYAEIVKRNSQMRHWEQALNRALSQVTPDTFEESIETVTRAIPKEADMESDYIPEIYRDWYEEFKKDEGHDKSTDMDTGVLRLDQNQTTGRKGTIMIVQGNPGAGKTSLLWNIFYHRLMAGLKGLIFSTEFSRETAVQWMASQASGVKLWKLFKGKKSYLNDAEWESLQQVYYNISKFGKGWLIDRGRPSLNYVKAVIREKVVQGGLDFVVLDYLQNFYFPGAFKERTTSMEDFMKGLHALCRELNIHMIVASQLSREARKMGDAVGWGGKGTGAIEETGWMVGTLKGSGLDPFDRGSLPEEWRGTAEENEIVTFEITKDRSGPSNVVVPMVFEKTCVRFRDLTEPELVFFKTNSKNGRRVL